MFNLLTGPQLFDRVEALLRTVFPEIHPMTKPIVRVVARFELASAVTVQTPSRVLPSQNEQSMGDGGNVPKMEGGLNGYLVPETCSSATDAL